MAETPFELSETSAVFIRDQVESGKAGTADEVVDKALLAMKRSQDHRERKLTKLRTLIQEGEDAYEAGDFIEVDDIKAWLDTLGRDEPAS